MSKFEQTNITGDKIGKNVDRKAGSYNVKYYTTNIKELEATRQRP